VANLIIDDAFWIKVGIAALLAVSVYLPVTTGALSVPQAGLAAIGAYSAVLAYKHGIAFWPAVIVAVAVGSAVGFLLTLFTARLSLFGLAIITVGFGEIVRVILVNLDFTGGSLGIVGIPLRTTVWTVYIPLALIVVLVSRLEAGPLGRSLAMIRTDRDAAEAAGVNTLLVQRTAIFLSAPIAAYAGVMQAFFSGYLDPSTFGLDLVVTTMMAVVLGGMTSIWGAIVGSVFISLVPELFRDLARWRIVAYGVFMVVALGFRTEGLISRSLVVQIRSVARRLVQQVLGARSPAEVRSI